MRVRELVVDWSGPDHIARHGVSVDEVEDIVYEARNPTARVSEGRFRVIGQTHDGRFLAVFLARRAPGAYALVTARPASERERRSYRRAMR